MTWLLCDYGEVLSLAQPDDAQAALEAAVPIAADTFWDRYWQHREAYDRGDTGAVEYWTAVLRDRAAPSDLQRLLDLDAASWLHPNPASLAAAGRAAGRGLRLALFSNAPMPIADEIDRQPGLSGFAPRLFSCRLRAVKPEPAAYAAALAALGAEGNDVVFFDDRPDNVASARRAGIRATVFNDPAQFDAVA